MVNGRIALLAMPLLLVAMETKMLKNGKKKYLNDCFLRNHIRLRLDRFIHHIGLYRLYAF